MYYRCRWMSDGHPPLWRGPNLSQPARQLPLWLPNRLPVRHHSPALCGCVSTDTTNTQPKHTSLFRIASSHKTSLQKWPYKILCNTGGRFSPLALASMTQENWLLTSNTFKFQTLFWSILNHSSKIKHLKGLKKVWIPWLNYPKDVVFSVVSQTNSMHIDEADCSSCSIEHADYPNLLSLLLL